MTPPSDLPLSPHDLGAIIGRVQSRYIRAAPPREVFEPLLTDLHSRIRDVRVGPDGAVYVLTDTGSLLKLTPG